VRLLLGSRNRHKLLELSQLLEPHELVPLPETVTLPPEIGTTFADNALEKARATAFATAALSLGEDSGIEVPALGGAPGIRSARFAGDGATDEQNLQKLLSETAQAVDRRAAYVCALAAVVPDGEQALFEGRCEGRLALSPRGHGGFGYDPIFLPDEEQDRGLTMAELPAERKNQISHRGRAARLLREWLAER
jgi:XTP/dITP diphosphohydrolase